MTQFLTSVINLVMPKAPSWLGTLLGLAIPLVFDLVKDIMTADISGAEKLEFVLREVRDVLDESFDGVPAWADLSEARRDRILTGLVELVLFIHQVAGEPGGIRSLRSAARELRRARRR